MKAKFLRAGIVTLAMFAGAANAQTLQPSENDTVVRLEDVVVSSLKVERKVADAPISVAIVNSLKFEKRTAFTVADGLADEPGIFMGGDGVWSKNVNIRGLGEDRLVTMVDGNRIETATDLTASLSMIDANDIERVEVIKGAQSVLYGSGAMGGIVNVITKDGHFADDFYVNGNVLVGLASVNVSNSEYVNVNVGDSKWYVKLNAGHGFGNDIKTPQGDIKNSGYETNNIAARAGFKPAVNHIIKLNFQRNESTDVGIPGGAAFAPTATARYKDINRTLFNANYEIRDLSYTFTSLKFTGFVQNIIRNVEMNPNSVTEKVLPNGNVQITEPTLVTPRGTHLTFGGNLQGTFEFSERNTLVAGIDVWRRNITGDRTKYITVTVQDSLGNVLKTNHIERGETPLPKASFMSAGIFVQDEMRFFANRLNVTVGGRIDGIFVENKECHDVDYIITNGEMNDHPAGQRITFEKGSKQDLSWSANLGAIYKITNKLHLVMNGARSYRSPSLEERFKYIDLTSKVRLGNPDLKSEDGISGDLGVRFWGDRFIMQASGFINKINNMIVERDGVFIYQTTDGATDTVPALILDNVGKALLYGVDFSLNYNIINGLNVFASGSYTMGIDKGDDSYLPNIPPMKGVLGVSYTYPKAGTISVEVTGVGEKHLTADYEKPTSAYGRLDIALNSRVLKFENVGFQFFGGIDNVTDEAYTNFFSTNRSEINYEPGRNFYIKGKIIF